MRRTLVLLAAAAGVVLSATPAAAHATLVDSNPRDGATVAEVPAEITLEFSEPVQRDFAQVVVLDANDGHHEVGEPTVVGSTVTQAVDELPAGDYRISYRIGSADGHPITDTLTFTVTGEASERPVPEQTQPQAAPTEATQAPEHDQHGAAPDPAASETPLAASEESGAPLRWLGAGAAIAAVVVLLFVLLRRPGGSGQPSDSDTVPQ